MRILNKNKYLIVIILSALTSCNSTSSGSAAANTVYIDPSVSVSGDGSIGSPYKYWSEVTFTPGYSYLQKRGTAARESVIIGTSGTAGSTITIGAYGTGALPIIQGSETESGWSPVSGNIYSKTINPGPGGGLGLAAEDGTVLKNLQWNTDAATTFSGASAGSYSYNYNTGTVYVWCSDNADPDMHTMEISRRLHGVNGTGVSYISINNLHVRYASLHGISFADSHYITVSGCRIEKSGGAVIIPSTPLYAGNGIEFGNSSSNCLVEDSIISDIFDSGISPQTYSSGCNASNFVFRDSEISKCGFAGVEIVVLTAGAAANSHISNVTVSRISITDSGRGWSGNRYDGEGRGIKVSAHLSGTDSTNSISGVLIEQCTISGSDGEGIFLGGNSGTVEIRQCSINNNNLYGILAQEPLTTTLKLKLSTSLIYVNGSNNGADNMDGVAFNVQAGQGFSIINNTFSDNARFGFQIWLHAGDAVLINNVFDSDIAKYHLASFAALPGTPVINNNCFKEFGADKILYYNPGTPVEYSSASAFDAAYTFAQNNIGSDPQLNTDLTIQSDSSPCYMAGDNSTGITTDRAGNNFRNPPSIGAYEYY
jgi:hypothetical protein